MMRIDYINLTNGIEALLNLPDDYHFIRIQSTICEQKNWDRLIQDLDYDFLMNVALGNEYYIYDYGARKPIPRAVYQGLEFLKYVLYRRWLSLEYKSNVVRRKDAKRNNCNDYFEKCYRNLKNRTLKKLDYFIPYVVGEINIISVTSSTIHDGDKEYYKSILWRKVV